jgi:hypothetical protein
MKSCIFIPKSKNSKTTYISFTTASLRKSWRHVQYRIKRFFSGVHACVHGADSLINWINGRLFKVCECIGTYTYAWTPEKNRLILIILQCNTQHKNIFLHIPGLKITPIKIPRNVVNDVGTLTTCVKINRHYDWCTLHFW